MADQIATLLSIAWKAVAVHRAKAERNTTREAYKRWLKDYGFEDGRFNERGYDFGEDHEEWQRHYQAAHRAKRKLDTARATLSRAISSADAGIQAPGAGHE